MKQEVATVGLDLAKNVFQRPAIAADGGALIRRKLRRSEVWPAASLVDTEIRCFHQPESINAEKEVHPRVQA